MDLQAIFTAVVTIALGAILCFYGLGFIRTSIIIAGFLLGYLISRETGATFIVQIVAGAAGSIIALVLVRFIRNIAERLLGFLMGGLIGLQIAQLLQIEGGSVVVIGIVIAASFICALLMNFMSKRVLIYLTASGGASVLILGVTLLLPFLAFLKRPTTPLESALGVLAWVVLLIFGIITQLRLFRTTVTRTVIRA